MPYRGAHWWVLAIFPFAAAAFWPGYLSIWPSAPLQMHAHAVTATLWLLLLAAQSAAIHRRARLLHRTLGLVSLALVPLFMAGGMGIFIGMAQRYVAHASPFHVLYAPRLAWLDLVAVGGFAACYHEALRHRRDVGRHAGYLLATTIFLLPPILGRLAPALPPLTVGGAQDMWKLGVGFQLANAVAASVALAVALRAGRAGRPFRLAALLTVAGALLFQLAGGANWWIALYARAATLPAAPADLAAGAVGALVAWSGWTAGESRRMAEAMA